MRSDGVDHQSENLFFSGELLELLDHQQRLGNHVLEPVVLGFQFLELAGVADFRVAQTQSPPMKAITLRTRAAQRRPA